MSVVPPVLGALEEVSLSVLVREGGVEVAGQAGPGARDQPRVPGRHAVLRQAPVVLAWGDKQ